MAHFLFHPERDLDDAWVYVISHDGKHFALFPYINAMTPVPALASICHQIDGKEITKKERSELAALIKQHQPGGAWVFDGVFAWLVTPVEWNNVMSREIERQNSQMHAASGTAAPRRKAPLRERQLPSRAPKRRPSSKSNHRAGSQ